MITPNTAAALIGHVAQNLHPFDNDATPEALATLAALARRARWLADVAEAEGCRRRANLTVDRERVIARDGTPPEREAARGRKAFASDELETAERRLAGLMEDRPSFC